MSGTDTALIVGPAVTLIGIIVGAYQVIRAARITQSNVAEGNRLREAEAVAAERARLDARFDAELDRLSQTVTVERDRADREAERARAAETREQALLDRLRELNGPSRPGAPRRRLGDRDDPPGQ